MKTGGVWQNWWVYNHFDGWNTRWVIHNQDGTSKDGHYNILSDAATPPVSGYSNTWRATAPSPTVTAGAPPAPTVTCALTSPTPGATFTAPATFAVQASASHTGSTVTKVEFFDGGVKIGEDAVYPYTLAYSNVPAGSPSLTAKATFADGTTKTSQAVSITVTGQAPTITAAITSPASGATYTAPASIGIAATASHTAASVTKIEFYDGGVKIGEDTTSPYSYTYSNVAAGSLSLTAKATFSDGSAKTTSAVNVTVNSQAPTITAAITSPASGATFTEPASITIDATASHTAASVTKIEFFDGGTKIGEDTTSPYSYTYSSVAAGSPSLTAKATFSDGSAKTTSAVNVTVDPQTPPSGSDLTVSGAGTAACNGEYFADGTSNGLIKYRMKTGGVWQNWWVYNHFDGWNTRWVIHNQDGTSKDGHYNILSDATTPPVSGYSNTWRATAPSPTVTAGSPPPPAATCDITSPASGANFTEPATVAIQANASSGSTVVKVEFFDGNTKIGEDTTSPYSYSYASLTAGSYSLTALATFADGTTSTSSAVNVNVTAVPPTITAAITSPASGTSYTEPASIAIQASASNSAASVTKVEFFDGGTKLGEDTTSPYSYTYGNVAAGSPSLTAKATFSDGSTKTSSAVNVTVNPQTPPSGIAVTSLTLIDSAADVELGTMASGDVYDYAVEGKFLNVRANTSGTVGSVKFVLDGTPYRIESYAPYTIAGDNGGDYWDWTPSVGTHTLEAIPYTQGSGMGTPGTSVTVSFTVVDGNVTPPPSFSVTGFTLIDANTDNDLRFLSNGGQINLAVDGTDLSVRADVTGTVGSVKFLLDGSQVLVDNGAPFAILDDSSGDYNPWTPTVGTHTLSAIPYDQIGAGGTAGVTYLVTFTVVDTNNPPPPPANGGNLQIFDPADLVLVHEIGAGETGNEFTQYPAGVSQLQTILGETCRVLPNNQGDMHRYFAWRIGKGRGLVAGKPYVLSVEFPDDQPRSMWILNRGGEMDRGVHTGTTVGDILHFKYVNHNPESRDVPNSGGFLEWRQFFHLHHKTAGIMRARDNATRDQDPSDGFWVIIAQSKADNQPCSQGAAVRRIRLYEVQNVSKYYMNINYPPASLPKRHIFWREEMADTVVDHPQMGTPDDQTWYEYKARLMRFLGVNTFAKDLLEFGHNQGWPADPIPWNSDWYNQPPHTDRWGEIVQIATNNGLYLLPYYEYSGSIGQDPNQALGIQDRCEPLTRTDGKYTHVWWVEGANCDVTDPDFVPDCIKVLEKTITNFKGQGNIIGAWFRTRVSSMPISFADAARQRFANERKNGVPVSRAQLIASQTLLDEYYDWWFEKRRAFLRQLRDYIQSQLGTDASLLFTADYAEGSFPLPGRPKQVVTDNQPWWTALLTSPWQQSYWVDATDRNHVLQNDLHLQGLLGWTPNWGDWEWHHGAPPYDPQRYTNEQGLMQTYSCHRSYTVASKSAFDAFRTQSGLAMIRSYPLNENELDGITDYFVGDMNYGGPYEMMVEALAMANGDPRYMGYLASNCFNRGFPEYTRRFNAAFLSLPALPSVVLSGAASDGEVVVRKIDAGVHGVYLAIVNTGLTSKTSVQITLPAGGTVTDNVTGQTLQVSGGQITLNLYPYELKALRIK